MSLVLALVLGLVPQAPVPIDPPPVGVTGIPAFRGVVVDATRGDGTIGARAETYKLEAAACGVDVMPLFGPRAPSLPIRFALDELRVGGERIAFAPAKAPRADGGDVVLDHGAVSERWRPSPRAVEQSFVLKERLDGRGVRIAIATTGALEPRRDGDDVVFDAAPWGTVRYRHFAVADARGRSVALPIGVEGRTLVLEARAADLQGLVEPLVFDPVVTAVAIDRTTSITRHPDAAIDRGSNGILVVYQEQVANNDHDVMAVRYRLDGSFEAQAAIDSTTSDSFSPSIAHDESGRMFATVWRDEDTVHEIRLRRVTSVGVTGQTTVTIAQADLNTTSFTDPGIGGSSAVGSDRFLIVWGEHGLLGAGSRVRMTSERIAGGTASIVDLDPDALCTRDIQVEVSKTAGATGHWGVVFRHRRGCASLDHDIAFAVVRADGTRAFGPTLVQSTGDGSDDHPAVASAGDDWFVVFDRDANSNGRDLIGAGYRRSGTSFTQSRAPLVLSAIEPGVTRANDQQDAAIDHDGCRYTYVYVDGATPQPRAATFALVNGASALSFSAGAVPLASSTRTHGEPSIVFTGSSTTRSFVCWTENAGTSNPDVAGVVFDATATGSATRIVSTGCGTRGIPTMALALSQPYAVLGGGIGIDATRFAGTPFLLVGVPAVTPTVLCNASVTACKLGLSTILLAVSGPSFGLLVACDPTLVGVEIAFQGLDLGASGGCNAAVIGSPFTMSDTLVVRVL